MTILLLARSQFVYSISTRTTPQGKKPPAKRRKRRRIQSRVKSRLEPGQGGHVPRYLAKRLRAEAATGRH